MKQKEVIFRIVKEVLGSTYSAHEPMRPLFGPLKKDPTGNAETYETMKKAISLFKEAHAKGSFELPKDCQNDKYIKNLFYNWLQKDERLNGGKKKIVPQDRDIEAVVDLLAKDGAISSLLEIYRVLGDTDAKNLDLVKKAILRFVVKKLSEERATELRKAG